MDIEKAKRALVNAHNAGDVEAARMIAKAIKQAQGAKPGFGDSGATYGGLRPVTDPALLAQLEAGPAPLGARGLKPVTDPDLLRQLESSSPTAAPASSRWRVTATPDAQRNWEQAAMTPREELQALRRMAELEAKAAVGGATGQRPVTAPDSPQSAPSLGERFMQGVSDPLNAGAQMLTHALPDSWVEGVNTATQYVNEMPVVGPVTKALGMVPATAGELDTRIVAREADYQGRRAAAGEDGMDWARLAGNVVATLPIGAGAGVPAGLAGAVGRGVAAGGAYGALAPVTQPTGDFWGEKAGQVGEGMVVGGIAGPAMHGLSRVIQPQTAEPVKELLRRGVTPTPGQILGGVAARAEEKLASIPVVGDAIRGGQRRAIDQFNRAVYDDVLAPIGASAPKGVGREVVAEVGDAISRAYDDILPHLRFRADPQFVGELSNLSQLVSGLPRNEARQFSTFVADKIKRPLSPNGTMDGRSFKELESALSKEIARFAGSPDAYQQKLGDAFRTLQQSLRDGLSRSNQGVTVNIGGRAVDAAERLRNVNEAWARLVRLERAAGAQGAAEGVFTPAQLGSAVRAADHSVRKRAYARGDALMQDLADAGRNVLGSKYPDSGTAGRLLMGGAALGYVDPLFTAGSVLGTLPYTAPGQRLAAALLAYRPGMAAPVAEGLRSAAPTLQSALAAALLQPGGISR